MRRVHVICEGQTEEEFVRDDMDQRRSQYQSRKTHSKVAHD